MEAPLFSSWVQHLTLLSYYSTQESLHKASEELYASMKSTYSCEKIHTEKYLPSLSPSRRQSQ